MKKFLSIVLTILIISSTLILSVCAANPVKLKLVSETDTVYAGDEFVVKLTISDNSKMSGAAIDVNYDKSKLEFVSGAYGAILDSSAIMSIKDISGEKGKVRFTYLSQSSEVTSEGTLITLRFKALNNASGNAELNISVENSGDFISLDMTRLSYTVENSKVKIINSNSVSESESIKESETESETISVDNSIESTSEETIENKDDSNENTDNTKWVFLAMIIAGVVIIVSVTYISKSSKPKKKRKK